VRVIGKEVNEMVIEFDESYNITIQKWSVRSPLKTKLTSFSSNSRLAFFSLQIGSNWASVLMSVGMANPKRIESVFVRLRGSLIVD
jgi:hypothetical protein